MFKLNNKRYVLVVMSISAILVSLFSLGIYLSLKFYSNNRIYFIPRVPEEYRHSLVGNFIDHNYREKSILLLGDSQPYGALYPSKYAFSTLLENKLKKNIINLAVPGSRISYSISVLEYLYQNNMKFEKVIFNVNQNHIPGSAALRLQESKERPPKDFLIGILNELNSFTQLAVMPDLTEWHKPKGAVKFEKLNRGHFKIEDEDLKAYARELETLIDLAKKVSNDVIIYITPYCLSVLKGNDESILELLEQFSKHIFAFCEEQQIRCINVNMTEDEFYFDFVHFNSKGHEKMSDILFDYLR